MSPADKIDLVTQLIIEKKISAEQARGLLGFPPLSNDSEPKTKASYILSFVCRFFDLTPKAIESRMLLDGIERLLRKD